MLQGLQTDEAVRVIQERDHNWDGRLMDYDVEQAMIILIRAGSVVAMLDDDRVLHFMKIRDFEG